MKTGFFQKMTGEEYFTNRLLFILCILLFLSLICPRQACLLDPNKRITQYDIRVYKAEDGLPMNSLKKVFQDTKGYIWIGTQEGLVRFDGVEFKLFEKSNYPELKCNFIWDIAEDSTGNLWVATSGGGISKYNGKKFVSYDTSKGLVSNFATRLLVASNSTIWIGTEDGLCQMKNGIFRKFTEDNGLTHLYHAHTLNSILTKDSVF